MDRSVGQMTLAVSAGQQTQFTAARTLTVVSRSRSAVRGRVAPPGYQEGTGGAGLNNANGRLTGALLTAATPWARLAPGCLR